MDTSRVNGVKAPQHRGTPRSHILDELDAVRFMRMRLDKNEAEVRVDEHRGAHLLFRLLELAAVGEAADLAHPCLLAPAGCLAAAGVSLVAWVGAVPCGAADPSGRHGSGGEEWCAGLCLLASVLQAAS